MTSKAEPAPSGQALSPGVLSRVWLAAIAVWGVRWTSSLGDLPVTDDGKLTVAGSMWAQGLAGFSEPRILAALGRFVDAGAPWPPNLPELRNRCLGIPTFEQVRRELAGPADQQSRFSNAVWQRLDHPRLRVADYAEAERMHRDAYGDVASMVVQGVPLPEKLVALPTPESVPPQGIPKTREERIAHLQQLLPRLGETFNPATADPNYDPVAARKQQERAEAIAALSTSHEKQDAEEDSPW